MVPGADVVVVVVEACPRLRPLLSVVRPAPLPSLLPPMRFNFDEEFSRLREREGFLGALCLATSLMPSLGRNKEFVLCKFLHYRLLKAYPKLSSIDSLAASISG